MILLSFAIAVALAIVAIVVMVSAIGVYAAPDHRWDDDREPGTHS